MRLAVTGRYRLVGANVRLDAQQLSELGIFLSSALEHADECGVEFQGAPFASDLAIRIHQMIGEGWDADSADHRVYGAELAMDRAEQVLREAAASTDRPAAGPGAP